MSTIQLLKGETYQDGGGGKTIQLLDGTAYQEQQSVVDISSTPNLLSGDFTLIGGTGVAIQSRIYSYASVASLPTDAADLTLYTLSQKNQLNADDADRFTATGSNTYTIHQYKNLNTNNSDNIQVTWNGQSTVATSAKTAYLQVYNQNASSWEQVDSDNVTAADTDFNLSATITANPSYYYDASNYVTFRVYQ